MNQRVPTPAGIRRLVIGVGPSEFLDRHTQLFALLEQLYPVAFNRRPPDCAQFGDASLVLGIERGAQVARLQPGAPCMALLDDGKLSGRPDRFDVRFADTQAVPPPLRGSTLTEYRSAHSAQALVPTQLDTVLATRDGTPVWMVRRDERQARVMDIASVPLPTIGDDSFMVDYFGRSEFMALLPILDFLQRLTRRHGWHGAPARACIVFDDVNLRGPAYGCLEFAALAEHAALHDYHASIAMIPLDATRVWQDAARLFRERPRHLSLVIHGNNHQPLELARRRPPAERMSLLAQARQRAGAFCDRQRLPIDAVMEPPYGTIHADYFEPLAQAGFEAALITPRQFRDVNCVTPGVRAIGMGSTEVLAGGLAMIPRITADRCWRTDVHLASFLGQPIVIAGHHFDADDGLEWVDAIAGFVNGMGNHAWQSPAAIARSQYSYRVDREVMHLLCDSRHLEFRVPDGVSQLVIERRWMEGDSGGELRCIGPDGLLMSPTLVGRISDPVQVQSGAVLEIRSPHPDVIEPGSSPVAPTGYRLRARRALAESWDRAYPHLPRALRRRSAIVTC